MLTYHYITSFCKWNLYLFISIQLFNSMFSLLVTLASVDAVTNRTNTGQSFSFYDM
ncbi:hypothetical protein HanXRQr2_Chr16g0728411 [Helianthus annuus]|uniref:Uncharacterized protein n=1 Tax=Helianthus annuus TaxID=4232 RepID=A0A9K3GX93_HELAN|nr:hypothetical protein HanXRQr2_Chr16g0728411 [Helianthus annuus]KAJ0436722.1 hypothetical protein HanHA300_Chr16g0593891 [Helianthus annuus]KAJ0459020.1 hypothetical protein HanHA89_Chr16g0644221 [Helianthus annuus]